MTWRDFFKSGFFWFWSLVLVVVTGLLNQWAVPAIIDRFEDDPIVRTETRIFHPWTDRLKVNPAPG